MDAVKHRDVCKWRDTRPNQPVTANGYLRVVKTMMSDMTVEFGLSVNPAARVRYLREETSSEEEDSNRLTAEELARVLVAAQEVTPQWHPFFATIALTGARYGAVSALLWKDVDFQIPEITFRRAQYQGDSEPKLKTTRQTGIRVRGVPIEPYLANILKDHRERLLSEGDAARIASGLVFPFHGGEDHPERERDS